MASLVSLSTWRGQPKASWTLPSSVIVAYVVERKHDDQNRARTRASEYRVFYPYSTRHCCLNFQQRCSRWQDAIYTQEERIIGSLYCSTRENGVWDTHRTEWNGTERNHFQRDRNPVLWKYEYLHLSRPCWSILFLKAGTESCETRPVHESSVNSVLSRPVACSPCLWSVSNITAPLFRPFYPLNIYTVVSLRVPVSSRSVVP